MTNEELNQNEFDRQYGESYRQGEGHCGPTNPENRFDEAPASVESQTNNTNETVKELAQQMVATDEKAEVFNHPVVDYINTMLPNGAPVNSRHKFALKLANDLMILLDGDEARVKQVLLQQSWVNDVITERGMSEMDRIIDAAKKLLHKRESENLTDPQPSKEMRRAIEQVTGQKYNVLVRTQRAKALGQAAAVQDDITLMLDRIGTRLERLFKHYVLMSLLCHHLKRRHYISAVFVGGGFGMTLMTRMWYRFWAEPSRRCRLNSIVELIGRSGSGKHIAVFLYRLMMEPVKKSDAAQVEALNRWNEERDQKSGGEKNKTPRPKGILRCLPSEASAAAIREAEFNAKETIDNTEVSLHVSQFNSELDDLLAQQKKGYMNIEALFLKSLHNEPAGSFLKTSSSMVGEYDVHFNGVYTGTEDALAKQNTTSNFARGLLQRLACVPMGDTNFEMRENRVYTEEDQQCEKGIDRVVLSSGFD